MSISKDEDLELHLKKKPNSCFINNYFDVGSNSWHANIDIQLVFDKYKTVTYIYQYFPKTEDQFSMAMKQAAKEAFKNNMHHNDTIKAIAIVYSSNREYPIQEAGYMPCSARIQANENLSSCIFG